MMFDGGEQNLIPGLQVFPSPTEGDEIHGLGGAARKNDALWSLGADKAGDFLPNVLILSGGFLAQRMDAAVDVRVGFLVIARLGFDDAFRLLRGGRVIEVNKALPPHLA